MKWLLHFILSHSIFISFCAAALSIQTLQLFSVSIDWCIIAFIFFATLFAYNIYWMVSKFSFSNYKSFLAFIQKSKLSLLVILVAFIGGLCCFIQLHLVMYNIIITFILFALYAIPVLPFKQLHFTRRAGFLKTVLLAFTWAFVTTLIPLQISIFHLDISVILIFINRFLFMLMLCIIFDKRDIAVDKIRGLQSLATNIKPVFLNALILFIVIIYGFICFTMMVSGFTLPHIFSLICTAIITVFFYLFSFKKRGYLFYYFFVDGLMLLSALLTALATV